MQLAGEIDVSLERLNTGRSSILMYVVLVNVSGLVIAGAGSHSGPVTDCREDEQSRKKD